MGKFYDEVPFSKNYNFDELTGKEASWVMKNLNARMKMNRVDVLWGGVWAIVFVLGAVLMAWFVIYETRAHGPDDEYRDLPGLIIHGVYYLVAFVGFALIGIGIFKASVKNRKVDDDILIAKGKIAGFKEVHVVPDDLWHRDGIKVLMTVCVSENEVLPDFDFTCYINLYKQMRAGDDIVIISFPRHDDPMFRYSFWYEPWTEENNGE